MTTIDTTESSADVVDANEPELCWLAMADLAPHPDNPRTSLGDLTELTRSIRARGILEPLVVLPANDDGIHLIVSGHRRHAAGLKADVEVVAAVVQQMTAAEVVEAMLIENVNRSALSIAEEVRAIEQLMSLDAGLTPAKLCKRIGRSQAWVRSRMAVTILPARWRAALDSGDLSLAAGEAAATIADLGPEHLDAVCEQLTESCWSDPGRVVTNYRDGLRRAEAYEVAVERAREKHAVVFTSEEPVPAQAKRLGELFDADGTKAHAGEQCHAVLLRPVGWGEGFESVAVCTEPRRHAPSRAGTPSGSDLASDARRPSAGGDDSHAKRQGRLARLAHATDAFARLRGGISQTDLTRLALRGLILEAGREATGYAATLLGYDNPKDVLAKDLLDAADSPAALVRVAAAVAAGLAETAMYWSSSSVPCRDYLAVLVGSGWTPDPWTAAAMARNDTASEPAAADDEAVDQVA